MREVRDHYFHKAKREGYRSRAAYKLIEIDDRRGVFSRGDLVLDCGAAPGGWVQVAAQRVGPTGFVVGLDLNRIQPLPGIDNIALIEGDFHEVDSGDLLTAAGLDFAEADNDHRRFDVVISDMAPGTTGDPRRDHFRSAQLCEALLERLPDLLHQGGNFVMKVFEGERYPELLAAVRAGFERCKGYKPKASRRESVEMYIIAHGYRGTASDDQSSPDGDAPPPPTPPRRKRPRGWST